MKFNDGRFTCIPEKLMDSGLFAEMSPPAVSIYVVLVRYADENGQVEISTNTLAEKTGCSRNTIIRHLTNLVDLDLITITRRANEHEGNLPNLYTVCPEMFEV